jgi:hypothetical protein
MKEPQNVLEALLSEIERVKEMISGYKSLPKNAGAFASIMMADDVNRAEMDTVQIIMTLKRLREYEN